MKYGFLISIGLFIISLVACLASGVSVAISLAVAYICFCMLAVRQGHGWRELAANSLKQVKGVGGLLLLLILLGSMTAAWRASGTLAQLVCYGTMLLSPKWFLLLTFLITAAVGYVIGTSFGVASIMGAVFMTIGTAGNVNPLLTAGAILSGVYFGDRTSPISSSFLTIASITRAGERRMVYELIKDGAVSFVVCVGIYGGLSLCNPLHLEGGAEIGGMEQVFQLSPWTLLPVIVILSVPVLPVSTWLLILCSTGLAGLLAVSLQGMEITDFVNACIQGYRCTDSQLGQILSGGGMAGMMEICVIVCISAMLSAALNACGIERLLEPVIKEAAKRWGRSSMATLMILLANGIFCNQTVPLYLADACFKTMYEKREQMITDLSDANILSGMIPWSISCSVPLAFLGVGMDCLPFAFFLYLTPLIHCLRQKGFTISY